MIHSQQLPVNEIIQRYIYINIQSTEGWVITMTDHIYREVESIDDISKINETIRKEIGNADSRDQVNRAEATQ